MMFQQIKTQREIEREEAKRRAVVFLQDLAAGVALFAALRWAFIIGAGLGVQ